MVNVKTVALKRIAPGLYMNHEHGFEVSREVFCARGDTCRWTASWLTGNTPGFAPSRTKRKFDSLAEARTFLRGLVADARMS